jgi:putative ABC transport system ATP-binding protein
VRDAAIRAEGVTVAFRNGNDELCPVKDVSISVTYRQMSLLVGPSGSGKTTFLAALGCLITPRRGSIVISGVQVVGASEAHREIIRRRKVGYVFQSANLLGSLNAVENVEVALRVTGQTDHREIRRRSLEMLERVGLANKGTYTPKQLSVGERQRVSIARALVKGPDVVLADEPTAALDTESAIRVIELLKATSAEQNAAVLVVTHDARLSCHADRVFELNDGVLQETHPAAQYQ